MVKTLFLLKNGLFLVVPLYELPGSTFFFKRSAITRSFSLMSSGSLSFLFLQSSFFLVFQNPVLIAFNLDLRMKIAQLYKAVAFQTFFFNLVRRKPIFYITRLIQVICCFCYQIVRVNLFFQSFLYPFTFQQKCFNFSFKCFKSFTRQQKLCLP